MALSKSTFNTAQFLKILVIEDNQRVAENIGDYLEQKGHAVDFAIDGMMGLSLAVTGSFDAIVLDIHLPGLNGFEICRRLRQEAQRMVPVLMLTAKDTIDDKLEGFAVGADDYLIKPFELRELEARLFALVKRRTFSENKILEVGDVRIDKSTRQVVCRGEDIALTRVCYSILLELLEASPKVVTRQELEDKFWNDSSHSSDVLRSHIYTLRKKLDLSREDSIIETIVGVGFRIKK